MPSQRVLASGVSWFDLLFLGRPNRLACGVVHGTAGTAIVDPGPTSTLDTVEASLAAQGLSLSSVTHLLLTHIHLDHAGATGSIVEKYPHIDVIVHERGAPHMADPSKLISSAGRLYGQDMDRLWGEIKPVPKERMQIVEGGETLTAAAREIKVAYTPGHASHHVSYFDARGPRADWRLHHDQPPIPSTSGIRKSMRVTSGRCWRNSSSASRPLAASATSSISRSLAKMDAIPFLTRG